MSEEIRFRPRLLQLVRRIGRGAAWAPIAVILLHSVLGRILGHEPYVDPIMHFSGGVAAAFFFRYAGWTGRDLLGAPNHLALDLLAFGLTTTAALVWEFGEFFSDVYFGTRVQHGVDNTMRDLILGTLGGGVYILIARLARSLNGRAS